MATRKLENTITVPVIDQNGHQFDEQTLINTAVRELFPKIQPVLIDWRKADGKRPTLETIGIPIPFNGQMYFGNLAWGSGIKRWESIGFPEGCDPLVNCGLLKTAERTIMTGRMLLSEGRYGGFQGQFKALVVKRGTMVGPHQVNDGFSLAKRSTVEANLTEQPPIKLDGAKLNWSVFQFIPWAKVKDELIPQMIDLLLDVQQGDWTVRDDGTSRPEISAEKRELTAIDKDNMILHPYIAQQYARCSAEFFARLATTAPIPVQNFVAVPSTVPQTTTNGAKIVLRYPIQSTGSMQAVRNNPPVAEKERIAQLEVIQYTIASKAVMAKGCFGVVDDSLFPEDVDIILSQDDIKMGSKRLGLRTINGCVLFNQRWAKGSGIGINGEWARTTLNADFDGDMIPVLDCKEFPATWQTVRELPQVANVKPEKTKSPVYRRDEMCLNGMRSLCGFATVVLSSTYLMEDRWPVAKAMGYKTIESMDRALSYYVSLGTDGFKTMVDLEEIEHQLGNLQKKIMTITNRMAPWSRWPNDWAFTRGAPGYWYQGIPDHEDRNALLRFWDGTLAQMCKITIPYLRDVIGEPVAMKPLSAYRSWAPMVDEAIVEELQTMEAGFRERLAHTNITDYSRWELLKKEWQVELEEWALANKVERRKVVYGLWRAAHSVRSDEGSAASVFMAFPDDVKDIIKEKPGLAEGSKLILVGLNYVLDQKTWSHIVCPVEVREFVQLHRGKKVVRKIVCAHGLKGKRDGAKPYPADILGTVEMFSTQPEVGTYMATINKAGRGLAWHCELVAN